MPFQTNILGMRIGGVCPPVWETTARGAAHLTGLAVDGLEVYREACDWMPAESRFMPMMIRERIGRLIRVRGKRAMSAPEAGLKYEFMRICGDMNNLKRTLRFRKMILPALVAALMINIPKTAEAREDWGVTVFGAVQATGDMRKTFVSPDFDRDYWFAALAISRKVYSLTKHFDLEVEGQVLKHMGKQHHEEFNALLVARWLTFPWNKYIDTTFASGNGLSYGTQTAKLEERLYGEHTAKLLNCIMFELTFALPENPRLSLVWRVHHRSGVFGLFDGVYGAANAMGIGLKYLF